MADWIINQGCSSDVQEPYYEKKSNADLEMGVRQKEVSELSHGEWLLNKTVVSQKT